MDFKQIRNDVISKVTEKSPEILVGFGLAGMLTSTVLAVNATPKALDILEQEEEELTKIIILLLLRFNLNSVEFTFLNIKFYYVQVKVCVFVVSTN